MIEPGFFDDEGGGEGGYSFLSTNKAHRFVRGGFDADGVGSEAEGLGDVFLHCRSVGKDARGFGDEGRIDVHELVALFLTEVAALFENK